MRKGCPRIESPSGRKKEEIGQESIMRSFRSLGLTKYQSGNEIKQDEMVSRDNMSCNGENRNVCRILEGNPPKERGHLDDDFG